MTGSEDVGTTLHRNAMDGLVRVSAAWLSEEIWSSLIFWLRSLILLFLAMSNANRLSISSVTGYVW